MCRARALCWSTPSLLKSETQFSAQQGWSPQKRRQTRDLYLSANHGPRFQLHHTPSPAAALEAGGRSQDLHAKTMTLLPSCFDASWYIFLTSYLSSECHRSSILTPRPGSPLAQFCTARRTECGCRPAHQHIVRSDVAVWPHVELSDVLDDPPTAVPWPSSSTLTPRRAPTSCGRAWCM